MLAKNTAYADGAQAYGKLFAYDDTTVSLTDYSTAAYTQTGLDAGKSGLLVRSIHSGVAAEGTGISYKGALSGDFSMDFRVFSKESYTHTQGESTHTAFGAGETFLQNVYADYFNPYLDLKEVAFTFTSTIDPQAYFTLYLRGTEGKNGAADSVSARVVLSTDTVEYGYGMTGETLAFDENAVGTWTSVSSTFSNALIDTNRENHSTQIGIDTKNAAVYIMDGREKKVVRKWTDNEYFSSLPQNTFGVLSADVLDSGYTLDITFTDVTDDSCVINANENGAKTTTTEDGRYAAKDGTHERYVHFLIYSVCGQAYAYDARKITVQSSPVTIQTTTGSVAVDPEMFEGGKKAIRLTTSKTGEEAEGTTFDLNYTFAGHESFGMDFRVYSQISYKNGNPNSTGADDPSPVNKNTYAWWLGTNEERWKKFLSDEINPFIDLKEVAFTFTSKSNPSVWFTLYVRGAHPDVSMDHVSARVVLCTDGQSGTERYGYGLSWDKAYRHANDTSTSFGTDYLENPLSYTKIGFDPTTGWVTLGTRQVRQITTNEPSETTNRPTGLGELDWGTLSLSDFTQGYTVSMEFTDVTSNSAIADFEGFGLMKADNNWNRYADFDTPFTRYANMLIYNVTANGIGLGVSTDIIKTEKVSPTIYADLPEKVLAGDKIDVTPTVFLVGSGRIDYDGEITWKNVDTGEQGNVGNTKQGWIFTPPKAGNYTITYSSINTNGTTYGKTAVFSLPIVAEQGYLVTLQTLSGERIDTVALEKGESYTTIEIECKDGRLLGWKYDGGLYPVGYTFTPTSDVTLIAETLDFALRDGASVRTENTKGYAYGLRFIAEIDQAKWDALVTGGYVSALHGYILPVDKIEDGFEVSEQGLILPTPVKDGLGKFAITSIRTHNYNRVFAARAYVEVTYTNGEKAKIYTAYDEEKNARSVAQTAKLDLADSKRNPDEYTAAQVEIFEKYINSAVELSYTDMDGELAIQSGNKRAYTAERVSLTDDVLTVKITFQKTVKTFFKKTYTGTLPMLSVTWTNAAENTARRIVKPTTISFTENVVTLSFKINNG